MSITDRIIVMKEGIVQQIGAPQQVYDDPVNLFVAKFLGNPPINVFTGRVSGGRLFLGEDPVLEAPGVPEGEVWVGIRPEGFRLRENGPMRCSLRAVEVMGRDMSVLAAHPACDTSALRAIIDSDSRVDRNSPEIRFSLRPGKVLLFSKETEERIPAVLRGEEGT